MNQIDLAPTLSLLMQVPIPYASLGAIIPELFVAKENKKIKLKDADDGIEICINSDDSNTTSYLSLATAVNCIQVARYLQEYFGLLEPSQKFCTVEGYNGNLPSAIDTLHKTLRAHAILLNSISGDNSSHLYALLNELNNEKTAFSLIDAQERILASYRSFLMLAVKTGREAWTQFNIPLMLSGAFLLLLLLLYNLSFQPLNFLKLVFKSMFSFYCTRTLSKFPFYTNGMLACATLCTLAPLSNSLVEQEANLLFFICQCAPLLLLLQFIALRSSSSLLYLFPTLRALLSLLCLRVAWGVFEFAASSRLKFDRISISPALFAGSFLLPPLFIFIFFRRSSDISPTVYIFLGGYAVLQTLLAGYFIFSSSFPSSFALSIMLPRFLLLLHGALFLFPFLFSNFIHVADSDSLLLYAEVISSLIVFVTGPMTQLILFLALVSIIVTILQLKFSLSHCFLINCEPTTLSKEGEENGAATGYLLEENIAVGWGLHCSFMARLLFFFTLHKFDFASLHVRSFKVLLYINYFMLFKL